MPKRKIKDKARYDRGYHYVYKLWTGGLDGGSKELAKVVYEHVTKAALPDDFDAGVIDAYNAVKM